MKPLAQMFNECLFPLSGSKYYVKCSFSVSNRRYWCPNIHVTILMKLIMDNTHSSMVPVLFSKYGRVIQHLATFSSTFPGLQLTTKKRMMLL